MGDVKIDLSGFKSLTDKLKNINIDEFGLSTVNELGNRVLRDVRQNTPVGVYDDGRVGGTLKRSWYVEPARKERNIYISEIKSDADYAGYVENGRRTRLRKDGSRGWVPGRFMLLKATRKVERQAPKIIKARLSKHLK